MDLAYDYRRVVFEWEEFGLEFFQNDKSTIFFLEGKFRGIFERHALLGLNPCSGQLASRLISGIHVTCSSYWLLGNKLSAFTCRDEQWFGQTVKPNRTDRFDECGSARFGSVSQILEFDPPN